MKVLEIFKSSQINIKRLDENIVDIKYLPDGGHIETNSNKAIYYYNKDDQIHRDGDLPAVIDKLHQSKEWYKNGQMHRENAPAVMYDNGNSSWYSHGQRNRLDGPAVDWRTMKKWFVNGVEMTDFIEYLRKTYLIPYPFEYSKPIIEELNQNKTKIIRSILQQVKRYSSAIIVLPVIHMFKTIGVEWPELDAIAKSGRDVINETRGQKLVEPDDIYRLTLRMSQPDHAYELTDWISMMEKSGYTYTQISNTLSDPQIVNLVKDWIDTIIKIGGSSTVEIILNSIWEMSRPRDVYVNWEKTDKPFDSNKKAIIRELLELLKDNAPMDTLLDYVKSLKYFKCDWPELTIIEKSLIASIPKQIDENITDQYFKTRMAQETKGLLQNINQSKIGSITSFVNYNTFIYNNEIKIIRTMFIDNKELIINYLKKTINYNFSNCDHPSINMVISDIQNLITFNCKWPELYEIVNEHKHKIIHDLLLQFKKWNFNIIETTKLIQTLNELGINWPELAIIEKSITAELKRLNEAYYDDHIPPSISMHFDNIKSGNVGEASKPKLKESDVAYDHQLWRITNVINKIKTSNLDNREFESCLQMLEDIQLNFPDIRKQTKPYTIEKLSEIKTIIIKHLLYIISESGNFNLAWPYTRMLKNIGVTWPELVTIEKSAKANLNKNINEAFYDDHEFYITNSFQDIAAGNVKYGLESLLDRSRWYDTKQEVIDSRLLPMKSIIIKWLLLQMKDFSFLTVNGTLDILDKLDQHWPELEIIKKSNSIELYKIHEGNRNLGKYNNEII